MDVQLLQVSFSVDITKNAKFDAQIIMSLIYSLVSQMILVTHRWVQKTIEFYGNPGDVLIVISASGKSQNMVNACKEAKKNLRK